MNEEEEMITISVANLITGIVFEGKRVPIAVWNPSDSTKLQSLSAGPKFPPKAQDYLTQSGFRAVGFVGEDARCQIPEEMLSDFQGWLRAQIYLDPGVAVMVIDPFPELKERLTGEYWDGFIPPLTDSDFNELKLSPSASYIRQPPPDEGENSGGRGSKIRFFREWNILIPDDRHDIFRKLTGYPAVILLTEDALKSTDGGRCLGEFGSYTLANNIGVVDYIPRSI